MRPSMFLTAYKAAALVNVLRGLASQGYWLCQRPRGPLGKSGLPPRRRPLARPPVLTRFRRIRLARCRLASALATPVSSQPSFSATAVVAPSRVFTVSVDASRLTIVPRT